MVNLKKLSKEEFGKFVIPNKIYKFEYRAKLQDLFEKLYFDNINYLMITNLFFLSILFSISVFLYSYDLIYFLFTDYIESGPVWNYVVIFSSWLVISLLVFYFVFFAYFFYHDSKFKRRENEIEKNLPEFIDSLVSNLKGGISLEKALMKSVRKDQLALQYEIGLINEKILMGINSIQALKEFRDRFKDSQVISRTVFLIEEGIRGGGNLASPLEKISQNLKRLYSLNDEIKSNSTGFAIVIRAITIVVAPLLFALAITLLTFIGSLLNILSGSGADIFVLGSLPPEFTQYLEIFSYAMIGLITLFSSLITSQLRNEKTYEALRYLPIYIIVSLGAYFFFSDLLLGIFGGILQ